MRITMSTNTKDWEDIRVDLLEGDVAKYLGNFAVRFGINSMVYLTRSDLDTLKYEIECAINEYEERNEPANAVHSDAKAL